MRRSRLAFSVCSASFSPSSLPLRTRTGRRRVRAAHHHLHPAAQSARLRARPALLSLRRQQLQCRLRCRRQSRPQLSCTTSKFFPAASAAPTSSAATISCSPTGRPATSTRSAARSRSSGARAIPVDETEFPVFRVGFADHSSWDMVWLRIDWNGHGFDAFVTDVNLGRTRVSVKLPDIPKPDQWVHLALAWDETSGIRFYVDGKLMATKEATGLFDTALDQFGPHSRIIGPTGVESSYSYDRGGDIDELRIYDRMLSDDNIAGLAKNQIPQTSRQLPAPSLPAPLAADSRGARRPS